MNANRRNRNQTNKRVLSKNVTKKENKIIIKSEVEEELTLENLTQVKQRIAQEKEQIKHHNKQLLSQYEQLQEQEKEINGYIENLKNQEESDQIEEIKDTN